MQRREFLKSASCASIAGLSLPCTATRAQVSAPSIGLELISVLGALGVDLRQTLRRVAAIGYVEVETLGSLGRPPDEVQDVLTECHLRSSAQHLIPDELYQVFQDWDRGNLSLPQALAQLREGYALDRLEHIIEQGIERAAAMHQKFLVWPVLFDEQVSSEVALRAVVDAFNRAGDLCRAAGLTFAFHNGSNAAKRIGPTLIYDFILTQTDPALVKMELDTYYLSQSGRSVLEYLQNHPDQFSLLHLKDVDKAGQIADLGQGILDFAAIIAKARRIGVQHVFVEHDRAPDPWLSARTSFEYVRRL